MDLQSCLQLTTSLVHIGQLSQLKRLNLYSCNVSTDLLSVLGRYMYIYMHTVYILYQQLVLCTHVHVYTLYLYQYYVKRYIHINFVIIEIVYSSENL